MDLINCVLKPVATGHSVYSYKEQGSFQDAVKLKAQSKYSVPSYQEFIPACFSISCR